MISEKPKGYQESKLLKETIHIKTKHQKHEFQIAKTFLSIREMNSKLFSHTKGHYG